MPKRIRKVAIVEDARMIAGAMAAWLNQQGDFEVTGLAATAKEGWELCLNTQPDLVLLDIELPDGNGLQLGKDLLKQLTGIRLLAVSGCTDPYTIWQVCRSGVHGFLEKTKPLEHLQMAIEVIAEDGRYFSPLVEQVRTEFLSQPDAFFKILSEREQCVLRLVAAGLEDDRIAARLGISSATVSVHRKHIRQKLEVHSDRELVAYARKWGLSRVMSF